MKRTHTVRVVTIDGNPWFVLADVRAVLDKARGGKLPLDADETRTVLELNGTTLKGHGLQLVSESGLYKLIMRSDKPQAKPFQDWVTREVLPSIRKTGSYELPKGELMPLPVDFADALEQHAKTLIALAQEQREKARERAEREAPNLGAPEMTQHVIPEVRRGARPVAVPAPVVTSAAPEIQTFTTTIGDIEVSLRCVMKDGEPWFIAKDVTVSLGYANGRDAVAKHVEADQTNSVAIRDGIRGNPTLTIISEEGLYSLIAGSRTEIAKLFRKWVFGTVLPSIRKHGGYILGQQKPEMTDMELLAKAHIVALSVIAGKDKTIAEQRRPLFHGAEKSRPETPHADHEGLPRRPDVGRGAPRAWASVDGPACPVGAGIRCPEHPSERDNYAPHGTGDFEGRAASPKASRIRPPQSRHGLNPAQAAGLQVPATRSQLSHPCDRP